MLTMYPKSVTDNIPAHVLRQIRKEVEDRKSKGYVGREILDGLREIKRGVA